MCVFLALYLSACDTSQTPQTPQTPVAIQPTATQQIQQPTPTPEPEATGLRPQKQPTPTQQAVTPTPSPGAQATRASAPPAPVSDSGHPVLAFYYPWYNQSTWIASKMSDLPTIHYNSTDDTTIERQVDWAAGAGITGFISSWWGINDQNDQNFGKVLAHASALESRTHYHFASSVYFECDSPNLGNSDNMVAALRYLNSHYGNDPHFFHWQGKPVIFFWDPLGNGRTIAQWANIRSQADPNNQMIWSAEGVNMDMLSVFDGIHLFSGGYWGIQHGNMPVVDQSFRNQVTAYNSAHQTNKIWAAGVIPGYDDTRVPGRTGTYIVPRNDGATYGTSWSAAIASHPEWITITSFNEWYEGAMIEPSVTYGMRYLTLTQQYAQQWHG